MTRRFAVASVAALLVAMAGCSSETAAPGTPSGAPTSTTASAVVVEPTSSSTTSSPAVSSSFVVPTPSVIDVPTPTSANPWPADLTPEQVTDAQAALDTYMKYQELVSRAGGEPGRDWTAEVSAVATAVAQQQLIELLGQAAAQGLRTTGELQIVPRVVSAEPGLVGIGACVDATSADFLDPNGQVITAPDAPGTYRRHTASAQVVQLTDASWRVAQAADNWNVQC
jgi:hypothetical protein